jgi:tRNA (guanine-N(7)-)-methyltransferase
MKAQKQNQSFSRRIGKSLSDSQKSLVASCFEDINNFTNSCELDFRALADKLASQKNLTIEIGFGMGEHLFSHISANPDMFFLGSEPYLNGVASLKKKCAELTNYILWPDDINLLLPYLPDNIVDEIYVLFPDPWPKRKQIRKRILSQERLLNFYRILKKNGVLHFATDIDDYSNQVLEIIRNQKNFIVMDKNEFDPHAGYVQTKYHSKAIIENRVAKFYSFLKN